MSLGILVPRCLLSKYHSYLITPIKVWGVEEGVPSQIIAVGAVERLFWVSWFVFICLVGSCLF